MHYNPYLQLAYLDMMVMRGEPAPRKIPTIHHWDTVQMRKREILEIKYGGFGEGHLREAIEIPSTKTPTSSSSSSLNKADTTPPTKPETTNIQVHIFILVMHIVTIMMQILLKINF